MQPPAPTVGLELGRWCVLQQQLIPFPRNEFTRLPGVPLTLRTLSNIGKDRWDRYSASRLQHKWYLSRQSLEDSPRDVHAEGIIMDVCHAMVCVTTGSGTCPSVWGGKKG